MKNAFIFGRIRFALMELSMRAKFRFPNMLYVLLSV